MGTLTISLEEGRCLYQRSATGYVDNDWLIVAWVSSDGTEMNQQHQVLTTDGAPYVTTGKELATLVAAIDAPDDAVVLATATVVNLGATPDDRQKQEIAKLGAEVAATMLHKLGEWGEEVWNGLPPVIALQELAKLGGPEVEKLLDEVGDWIRAAYADVVDAVEEWIRDAFGGKPNCNGVVLYDTFAFAPHQGRGEALTKVYEGAPAARACGRRASTEIRWWIARDVMPVYEPLDRAAVPGTIWVSKTRQNHVIGRGNPLPRVSHDLVWYNHHQDAAAPRVWDGPRTLGWAWEFAQVVPGRGGVLYAVTDGGDLVWRRNTALRDALPRWTDASTIGWGWREGFRAIMCDATPDVDQKTVVDPHLRPSGRPPTGQVVYAVREDGRLVWYRHLDPLAGKGTWANEGRPIELSLRFDVREVTVVFSGGAGVLYVLRRDGSLRWFRHTGVESGADTWLGGHEVGHGWGEFHDVFSTGGGNVYAVDDRGTLWWYRHTGWSDGSVEWAGREAVGSGWAARDLLVLANRVRVG